MVEKLRGGPVGQGTKGARVRGIRDHVILPGPSGAFRIRREVIDIDQRSQEGQGE